MALCRPRGRKILKRLMTVTDPHMTKMVLALGVKIPSG